jgi:hypothetical protein
MPSFDKETLAIWRERNIQNYLESKEPLNSTQRRILEEELDGAKSFLEQVSYQRAYKKQLEKRLSKP